MQYTFKVWHVTVATTVTLAYTGSYLVYIGHWSAPATLFFGGLSLFASAFLIAENR